MNLIDRTENKRLRNEDIERLRRALSFDSTNASAHAALGEKLAEIDM
jgi:hypothetical protein